MLSSVFLFLPFKLSFMLWSNPKNGGMEATYELYAKD